jgi:hypothetical protein
MVNDDLKQNSDDAEASEDASKGGDEHSNKDEGKNNAVEGGKQDNTDRTGRLPEVGQGPGLQSANEESVDGFPEPKGKGKVLGSSTELKKRPRDPKENGAPAERSSKVSRLSHAESSTSQAEHPLPTTETQNASAKTPTSTTPQKDAVAASDSHVQPPIELDTSVLTKELKKLDWDLLQVTEAVLFSIMETPFKYPSPLDPDAPQRLLNLYVRCWGEDWEAVRLRLTRQYLFVMPQVVKALVSAFLYDNILDGEASLLDEPARLRHTASLDGSGEAVCRYLQSEKCWSDLKHLPMRSAPPKIAPASPRMRLTPKLNSRRRPTKSRPIFGPSSYRTSAASPSGRDCTENLPANMRMPGWRSSSQA